VRAQDVDRSRTIYSIQVGGRGCGTASPSTIGRAASAGGLRAAGRDLRVLWRTAPLGTPVFIRR
jgi:hypothetical protein